jgi:hypothetical protein
LWRSRKQRIGLCPDRVIVSRNKAFPVATGADAAEWKAAVQTLPEVLKAFQGHEISVVIADAFARYTLLPWNEAVKSDEQWIALARHRFASLHGAAAAAAWDVQVTETAPQGPRLACAVDKALVEALVEVFASSQTHLASVQPFLVAAFNRINSGVLGKAGGGSCWLVVEEPGRLTLALIQRGVWTAVRTRRCDAHWRAALPAIIERESAFLALSEPCTRVIVCAQGRFDADMHDAFRTDAVSYPELALAA